MQVAARAPASSSHRDAAKSSTMAATVRLALLRSYTFVISILILIFGVLALHNPAKRLAKDVYCIAALVAALGGGAVATRQVWLQHLPKDQVPACGPDLFFMLENLPLQRALEKLFAGSGQCAEVNWKFLGFSIAEWSLAWFAALALYALWLAFRRRA